MYRSYNDLKIIEENKAQQSFLSQDELNKNISYLPKNGDLIIHFYHSYIERCNPENYEYIFTTMCDSVILKNKGEFDLPSVSELTVDFYNTDIQNLPEICPDTIKFFVVWLSSDRAEYIINIQK